MKENSGTIDPATLKPGDVFYWHHHDTPFLVREVFVEHVGTCIRVSLSRKRALNYTTTTIRKSFYSNYWDAYAATAKIRKNREVQK